MNISSNDIEELSLITLSGVEVEPDYYSFLVTKEDHSFIVKLLKNGQYLFTTLNYNNKKYPIEHQEFYMNETKNEVLQELYNEINLLKNSKTRIIIKRKWFQKRIQVEIFKDNNWEFYGYSSKY